MFFLPYLKQPDEKLFKTMHMYFIFATNPSKNNKYLMTLQNKTRRSIDAIKFVENVALENVIMKSP